MSDLKKAFGANVRLHRKARSLTQEQLAEMLNLNQRQLTRIENGVSFVSADVLENFAIALNIDIKKLFDFELNTAVYDKTGTDYGNVPYYKIMSQNNVVRLQQFASRYEKNKVNETKIDVPPDDYLIKTAQKLNKPITAQYFQAGEPTKTYIYYPDGSFKLLKNKVDDIYIKKIEKLLDKIKKVADSNAKLCYIDLALDSLGSRESRNKLKSLIEGMELIQK